MRLLILHPKIYNLNCEVCLKYDHDEKTGRMKIGRDGKPEERLLDCGDEFLAPCRDPRRGCPKGSPENPKTLMTCNELAYEHYRDCRAVGSFPDDPVVRRNAAIIREIEDDAERNKEVECREILMALIKATT